MTQSDLSSGAAAARGAIKPVFNLSAAVASDAAREHLLNVGCPLRIDHGNVTRLGSGSQETDFSYDASDRNSEITQGTIRMDYQSDADNRLINRKYTPNTGSPSSFTEVHYGYSSASSSPQLLLNASNTILEKYFMLPGGVLLTQGSASKFALPNVHGNIMATTDGSGTQTGTYVYDPFGSPVSGTPADSQNGASFAWAGQQQRITETNFTLTPIQMGARVYIPSMGRFLQEDPVVGGVQNNYIYPPDPVNASDFNGKSEISDIFAGVGRSADNMGGALTGTVLLLGLGACVIGSDGLCLVAVPALSAGIEGTKAYSSTKSESDAWIAVGISVLADGAGSLGGDFIAIKSMPYVVIMSRTTISITPRAATVITQTISRSMAPARSMTSAVTGAGISVTSNKVATSAAASVKATSHPSVGTVVGSIINTILHFFKFVFNKQDGPQISQPTQTMV